MGKPTAVGAPTIGPDELFAAIDRMPLGEVIRFARRVRALAERKLVAPEPVGCPVVVWDGPYSFACGRTLVDGRCSRHWGVRG